MGKAIYINEKHPIRPLTPNKTYVVLEKNKEYSIIIDDENEPIIILNADLVFKNKQSKGDADIVKQAQNNVDGQMTYNAKNNHWTFITTRKASINGPFPLCPYKIQNRGNTYRAWAAGYTNTGNLKDMILLVEAIAKNK